MSLRFVGAAAPPPPLLLLLWVFKTNPGSNRACLHVWEASWLTADVHRACFVPLSAAGMPCTARVRSSALAGSPVWNQRGGRADPRDATHGGERQPGTGRRWGKPVLQSCLHCCSPSPKVQYGCVTGCMEVRPGGLGKEACQHRQLSHKPQPFDFVAVAMAKQRTIVKRLDAVQAGR